MSKLKMKAEHYQAIEAAISAVQKRFPKAAAEYAALGRSHKRYRWDLFHAANRPVPAVEFAALYSYLNDEHIDNALRRIVLPYEVPHV